MHTAWCKYPLIGSLLLYCLLTACSDETYYAANRTGNIRLSVAKMNTAGEPGAVTRAATAANNTIGSIHLFHFSGTEPDCTLVKHESADAFEPGQQIMFYLETAASGTGANRVYALANIDIPDWQLLEGPITLAAFERMALAFSAAAIDKGGVPMAGYKDITLAGLANDDVIDITVYSMVAKITLKVESAIEGMEIYSVQLRDVPWAIGLTSIGEGMPDNTVQDNFTDGVSFPLYGLSQQREFVFWLPENRRGTVAGIASDKEKHKGNAPAHSTYIEVLARLPEKGTAIFYLYPGANSTGNFDIERNTHYSLTMILNGINEAEVGLRVVPLDQEDANCFIVAPGGEVKIPVIRALVYGGLGLPAPNGLESYRIVKLWDDNGLGTANGSLIASYDERATAPGGYDSHGYFTVTTSNSSGNALFALTDDNGTIYWSWHVWVTDDPTLTTWTPQASLGSTARLKTFMDRNLGAVSAGQNSDGAKGVFYQWGRKDPFPRAAVATAQGPVDMTTAVRNPTVFYTNTVTALPLTKDWLATPDSTLWGHGTSKTIYDPCPQGWRVPPSAYGGTSYPASTGNPWFGLQFSNPATNSHGTYWTGQDGNIGWWPMTGYRSEVNANIISGEDGYCWTATSTNDYRGTSPLDVSIQNSSYNFYYSKNAVYHAYPTVRASGRPVRCVKEE